MHDPDPTHHVPVRRLSPPDAQRLDAHLDPAEAGLARPKDAAQRDAKVGALLALIDQCPAAAGDDALVERTLSRIQAQAERQRLAADAQMLAARGGAGDSGGFNLSQMATAAGIVLIAAALLLPVASRNDHVAKQLACQNNLGQAHQAMAGYAADHAGTLPRGKVKPGVRWWHVGQPNEADGTVRSNSAHLYILVRKNNYLDPQTLACPSNAHAQPERMTRRHHDWPSPQAVSYSYQNQYTPEPIHLNHDPDLAVLADKNPLFVGHTGRVTHDRDRPTSSPSRLHQQRGQNVLTAGGQVRWTVRPTVHHAADGSRDNIWVVRGIRHYHGNETPSEPGDSFLVP
jgi:type II secretory pathway pseudopilin PulG